VELWAEFDAARPQLLGTLLDAVSHGLKQRPGTRIDSLPRMADFALWATACETALWESGTFNAAYAGNRDQAVDMALEADPVASAIRSLISTRTESGWAGTASDLLGNLETEAGEKVSKSKAWPASARALSGRVRRMTTFLRETGITITFEREGRTRTRIIRISSRSAPTRPSASSAPSPELTRNNGFDHYGPRTQTPSAMRLKSSVITIIKTTE